MSDTNQTPRLLDGYAMGEAITSHNGVVCYPAMLHDSEDKYIVKNISVPPSAVQLAALLLTGAYSTREEALDYYKGLAQEILRETRILNELSNLEGFVPYQATDLSVKADQNGYEVSLVAPYRMSLEQIFSEQVMTHQGILDLAMDLCTALSACRRAGYLYIDLKPGNVFYTENMEYRIGDLGFVSLASLRFASLPEKYHSIYTAPEIEDAFSQLNTTMDVYALGLVLYQAYNGGTLPTEDDRLPEVLLPPMYADYEMAEIILKACHPDQSKRWEDPTQLGQALVQYMQRNGVLEGPIIPAPVATPELDAGEDFLPEEEADDQEAWDDIPELALLEDSETDSAGDDTAAMVDVIDSEEMEQMLAQADELIAHVLPEPPVAPEPIEVPMPEPIAVEPEPDPVAEEELLPEPEALPEENIEETQDPLSTDEEEPAEASEDEEAEQVQEQETFLPPAPVEEVAEEPEPESDAIQQPAVMEPDTPPKESIKPQEPAPVIKEKIPRKQNPILRLAISMLLVVAVFALALFGFRQYQKKYQKTVESLTVTGTVDTIVVQLRSDADETLLRVTCSDAYGNTVSSKVTNGTAIFTNLIPQTRYTIRVTILGKYKLDGVVSDSFTTHSQTRVDNLTATLGPADGSVFLSFSVSGVECDEWIVSWSAPGTETMSQHFVGHNVTIYDLQIGKEYTFTLSAGDESNVVGSTQVSFLTRPIVRAENAAITAYGNGALTVTWQCPDGEDVTEWIVRCYNSAGYDQTVTTSQCGYTFEGMTHDTVCTVEIFAAGMTQGTVVSIGADPINIVDFTFLADEQGKLLFQWTYTGSAPEGGWAVSYSCDGIFEETLYVTEDQASLVFIPNGNYTLSLIPQDESPIFGHTCTFTAPEAAPFDRYGITYKNLQFMMCAIPNAEDWQWEQITQDAYKTTFAPGEQAGFVVWCDAAAENVAEITTISFQLRDAEGNLLDISMAESLWNDMWYQSFCELTIPVMPNAPGQYTMLIYFDGQYVASQIFSIA